MAPEHELRVGNPNSNATVTYRIEVNGRINQVDSGEQGDSGSGGWVEGLVDGGWDTFKFRGTIDKFVLNGGAQVKIQGQSISRKDAVGYDTRDGFSSGSGDGNDNGDDESSSSGGSTTPSRDTSGSTSVPVGSSGGSLDNARPGLGCVARPFYSQGDIEMHVGDGREYGSLQAAFNDVPHFVLHEVRIYVHGRTNDGNSAHIHSVAMANHVDFIVDGSDGGVIGGGGVNVSIDGKLDHIQFDSLKFEHISQCKDARFVNCDFNGNGTAAFSGKMGGKMLINCDIGSGNDDYAVFSIGNEMCELRNCTLRGNTAAVKAIGASAHAFTGNNNVKAPKKMVGGASDVFLGGERSN